MGNFLGKMNFMKFKNACVINLKGNTGEKKGVFIPIDDNHLFVSYDETGKTKAVYVDFVAFESPNSRYGDTHGLKLSIPKEIRERMSEEEQRNIPFFGNLKPYVNGVPIGNTAQHEIVSHPQNTITHTRPSQEKQEEVDDLPF